jgi:peptide/nickel transport system ATP-binding protein
VDDETLRAAVREAFDVPDPLSDPAAEEVFEEALSHALADDVADARRLLVSEFETICEKTPAFVEAENGAETACHLYYDHEDYVSGGGNVEREDVTTVSAGDD